MIQKIITTLILMWSCAFPAMAQEQAEIEAVKLLMQHVQLQSFEENREFCGFIGYDPTGRVIATIAMAGGPASCGAPEPTKFRAVANFHTHASFDPAFFDEVPSVQDMDYMASLNIDGYVGTPGGRLWFIDTSRDRVFQICGVGCLPQDEKFEPEVHGPVEQSYSRGKLVAFVNG